MVHTNRDYRKRFEEPSSNEVECRRGDSHNRRLWREVVSHRDDMLGKVKAL